MTKTQAATIAPGDIHDELARLVAEVARESVDTEHYATLIWEALEAGERKLPKISDLSANAKRIAKAADKLARELRLGCQLRIVDLEKERQPGGPVEAGAIIREGPESIWPFLRVARLLGKGGYDDNIPFALNMGDNPRLLRGYEADVGTPSALTSRLERLAQDARIVADLSKKGRPLDLKRASLLANLEVFWQDVTGEPPSASAEATWEIPRTEFGHFLKNILELSGFENGEKVALFNAGAGSANIKRQNRRKK